MLSATNVANPIFTPNVDGTWTATVEVSDGTNTDTDSAVITVGGGGGGGDVAAGQAVYDNNCAACHRLGT